MSLFNWSPGTTLEQLERSAIEQAFRFYSGNKTQTARALDIAIRTLESKLEKYAADDQKRTELANADRARREDLLKRQRGIITEQSSLDAANGVGDRSSRELPGREAVKANVAGDGANDRLRVESAQADSEEQPVPVPQRSKVQGVLPQHAAASGSRKGR